MSDNRVYPIHFKNPAVPSLDDISHPTLWFFLCLFPFSFFSEFFIAKTNDFEHCKIRVDIPVCNINQKREHSPTLWSSALEQRKIETRYNVVNKTFL